MAFDPEPALLHLTRTDNTSEYLKGTAILPQPDLPGEKNWGQTFKLHLAAKFGDTIRNLRLRKEKGKIMKKFIWISIVLLLVLAENTIACDTVRLTEHIDEYGKRSIYKTTKSILEKTPSWNLDKEPPFAIHKAAEIAKDWITKKYPKLSHVRIVHISLSPIGDFRYKDKWYYSIAAQAGADLYGISASSYLSVMVLFDGTVVGPSLPKDNEKYEEDCQ